MSKRQLIEVFGWSFPARAAFVVAVLLGGAGSGAVLGAGDAQANVSPPDATALPSGSYQSTCDAIRMVDGILLANCRRADQAMRPTSLVGPFACPNGVTNADGRLACSKVPAPGAIPIGSYRHSCSDIRIVDDVLFATCKRADQSTRVSSLQQPFACVGGVDNADGGLTCHTAPGAIPIGSYRHSCSDIRIVDDVLFATCKRADQSTRVSSLQQPFACVGGVDNADGGLTCHTSAAAPPPAVVWGAIAAADGRGDAAGIVDRSGTGAGATQQDAEADALMSCGGTRRGCEIKVSFEGGCGAYASSHKHSGSGTGQSLAEAEQQAVTNCRKNSCRIAIQYCPGR